MAGFENLFITYFIYGLAFFSMGLILLLEAMRTSSREQKGLVLPLAFFGLLHGLHEWLEIFIIHENRLGGTLPEWVAWFRLGLLTASFLALWAYGIIAFQVMRQFRSPFIYFGMITLPIYAFLISADVLTAFSQGRINEFQLAGGLARFLLAVPGAAVTTLGLRADANRARYYERKPLDRYLNWGAVGFALYSITQLIVPGMETILARVFNAEQFQLTTGIPIQGVRTVVALLITLSLFLATQFLERERQRELTQAQQARLEAIQQQESLRHELLRHTIQAQEYERARIARELHDEMAQLLTAFSFDLAAVQSSLPARKKTLPSIERLHDLRRQMSESIQRMVYDLRPAHLDELGLVKALEYLCDRMRITMQINPALGVSGEPIRLTTEVETTLFRIVQEALTNVSRHACTKDVKVCLAYLPEEVRLTVSDAGAGFDVMAERRGWGLAGMIERTEAMGGHFELMSTPGEGTTLIACVPIQTGGAQ